MGPPRLHSVVKGEFRLNADPNVKRFVADKVSFSYWNPKFGKVRTGRISFEVFIVDGGWRLLYLTSEAFLHDEEEEVRIEGG